MIPPRKPTSKPAKQLMPRLHFVTGNDEAEIRRTAQELAIKLAPADAGAFGLEVIEAPSDTVESSLQAIQRTLEAVLTLPFLGDGKLVWLKGATFLRDTPAGRSTTIHEALEKLLLVLQEGLPERTTLLISAPEPDKRRSFYKNLSSLASLTLCEKPDFGFNGTERDIINWTIQRAKERGITLEYDAAEILTARIGANSGQLEMELVKLITAVGQENLITSKLVRDLVPLTRAGGIFDLSNAIQKKNLPLCLDTFQQLRRQEESSIGILLAAIIPTVRNLLLAKDLMARYRLPAPQQPHFFASSLQKLPQEELSHLPRKKDGTLNTYGLGLAAQQAACFDLEKLAHGFLACRDTYARLISGQGSEDILLTQLLVRIVG